MSRKTVSEICDCPGDSKGRHTESCAIFLRKAGVHDSALSTRRGQTPAAVNDSGHVANVSDGGQRLRSDVIRPLMPTQSTAANDLAVALRQIAIGASVAHDGLTYSEIADIATAALAKAGL